MLTRQQINVKKIYLKYILDISVQRKKWITHNRNHMTVKRIMNTINVLLNTHYINIQKLFCVNFNSNLKMVKLFIKTRNYLIWMFYIFYLLENCWKIKKNLMYSVQYYYCTYLTKYVVNKCYKLKLYYNIVL